MKIVTQALTLTGAETESLTEDLSRWLSEHQPQVEELLKQRDVDQSGSVTEEDFQLGLLELGVPCQKSQLDILTQKLNTTNNKLSYQELSAQLHQLRLRGGAVVDPTISSEQDKQDAAEREDVKKFDQKERFIRLRVRMIPFDSAAHPGSFEVVLSVGRSVLSLMWIIQERVGIQTSQLKVFRSRVSTEEACLSPLSSLEECGFKGGSEICPTEATVYYDYTLPRMDCPILNCDHYFT